MNYSWIRTSKFLFCAFLAAVFIVSSATSSFASSPKEESVGLRKVVVVFMPRLSWDTLREHETPNIDDVVEQGSIANMSVRVLGSRLSASKGYATLSAGNRSTAVDPAIAPFLSPNETFDGEKASDVFKSQRGSIKVLTPAGLGLSFEQNLQANRDTLDKSEIGSFAHALQRNSKSIAVFGNADTCLIDSPECFERSVAMFGVDKNGVLRNGDISRNLISEKAKVNSRVRLDQNKFQEAVTASIDKNDVTAAECSDLERVDSLKNRTSEEVYKRDLRTAIEKCDETVGKIAESLNFNRDQLFVVSPNSPRASEQTTVFVARGYGIKRGYASSSTTRIPGAVTLIDVAPSILKGYGITIPTSMNENLFDWKKSDASSAARIENLVEKNDRAIAREETLKPVLWAIVTLFVVSLIASVAAIKKRGIWLKIASIALGVVASFPLVTFLVQPLMVELNKALLLIFICTLASIGLSALLYLIAIKKSNAFAVLVLSASYLIVQLGDIASGGRLQFNSIFGNATMVAGRFTGFNNQSFAILAAATILFVSMLKTTTSNKSELAKKRISFALVFFLVIVLFFDAAPQFGADVGGILAFTPTVFLIALILFEKRFSFKSVIFAGLITGGLFALFTAIDLARPASKRTHLGRFVESFFSGDGALTIQRKLEASLRSFTRSELIVILAVGIAFICFLIFGKRNLIKECFEKIPHFSLLFIPFVFLCLLGAALNDSGATIPAIMFILVVPSISLLVLDLIGERSLKETELVGKK